MESTNELAAALAAFNSASLTALALRKEALRVIPVVAAALEKVPYPAKALDILEDATRLLVTYRTAHRAVFDVETDMDSAVPWFLRKMVALQSLQSWTDTANAWQRSSAERDIFIAEIGIPEAQEGGTDV